MFEYFPQHYGWNFATLLAMSLGANLSEVDEACSELMEISGENNSAATEQFFYGWKRVGDRLFAQAQLDRAAGRAWSASNKFRRAAIYYLVAERTQRPRFLPRRELYRQMQEAFRCFVECGALDCEALAIPFRGNLLPALMVRVATTPAPCVLHFVGLDAMKEQIFLSGLPQELARRGVSTLIVDLPGAGESLRLHGLHTEGQPQALATACVDFVQGRPEVDPARIGTAAIGLAGYSALGALAVERRVACCAVLGASYDWSEMFRQCMATADAQQPLPSFFEHVKWAFGLDSIDACLQMAATMHLRDVLHRVDRPLLMLHGANEHTGRLEQARDVYEACGNSPSRVLRVLNGGDGGAEYCSIDNLPLAFDAMSDWLAQVLQAAEPAAGPEPLSTIRAASPLRAPGVSP